MTDSSDEWTADEYIDDLPDRVDDDDFPLSEIFLMGRYRYKLDGDNLELFVSKSIKKLVDHGAEVFGLERMIRAGSDKFSFLEDKEKDLATAIVNQWRRNGKDPDLAGPWFFMKKNE